VIDVGQRLKSLRQEQGLSQRELAKKVGVTNSTISLIELNRVSPSIASLKKVLDGLPITLADFFSGEVEENTHQVFFKPEALPDLNSEGIHYFLVGCSSPSRKMTIMHEFYQPGSDTGSEMLSHEGEEGGIVIRGQIELVVGEQSRVLGPGEAYYFDCRSPHRFRNVGGEECELVTASTPPTF
jgi:transcriptional regulator with XRE-family HTH domain